MALHDSFNTEINQVLFEGNSCARKVVLNRPRKLNSLTFKMTSQMLKKLKEYEDDSSVTFVILKGNGKAFCAGGDVVASYKYMTSGHWSIGAFIYRKQLLLNYLLATYKKPLVALIDGIVMGGGAGISMHAPYRIVTENTVFAMPEAAIGHFPDVGASRFLSRLRGYFGEYLGLTGAKINGEEMVACGLATHFVFSKDLQLLENALDEVAPSNTTAISQIISKFAHETYIKPDSACNRLQIINECFSRETVEDILLALEKQFENGEEKWIVDAINSMKSACPASLKVFLRLVREGRWLNFEQCLIREYTIFCHIKRRTVSNDFYEGIRAMLLDKDKNPKWQPSKLEQVTEEMVDRYFRNMDDDDWEPLKLPPRSSIIHIAPASTKSKL
ncbi:3-hydroxyisobutyryl-CoA hydrolase 1 [Melia azedarach]|uniref:3-hydroxyisobutyryl-CoA hydrolase 1 n=1 Tax=Melia azedarach TaxID=155640 RepID=A0ACC1X8Y0_MELAZ|nr:3-hydroxyisobutyryl-CoA hydrolase 1 [Melia azedarach]